MPFHYHVSPLCPLHHLLRINPANTRAEKVEWYIILFTSIEMDLEFLDRMSQISKRVRYILEESETLKLRLAERIAKRAEKAAEAAEVAEEIQAEVSEKDEDTEQETEEEAQEDEADEDDTDTGDDEAEKPLEPVDEEEAAEDNDFSDCWTCLCGRRR